MEPFVLDPSDPAARGAAVGAILAEEVSAGGRRLFHKGHRVTAADDDALARVDRPLHAVRLAPDDVHEDVAGLRLAAAVAGPGIVTEGPRQSRVNLLAAHKGLLRVDGAALTEMNSLPGVAVFSLLDRLPVLPGRVLAGAKITPVAIPEATLAAAEEIGARAAIMQVKPFRPLAVGVVVTEGLEGKVRDRFRETVRKKVGWFGGSVLGFADVANEERAVTAAIEGFLGDGADLIMTGGGNTIDPLDAALQSLPAIGAELVAFGAPAHPGSMFWLAYRGETPVFNLASCAMYAKSTSADLILPWVMAGERVGAADVAALGFGGLLERGDMAFRFPPYDEAAEAAPEPAGGGEVGAG